MSPESSNDRVIRISLPTPFSVVMVNAFLVKGEPLTLVDTGARFEDSYDRLVEKLWEHGVAIKDLEVILITHGHIDHMGLLGRLLEESNAQGYAHAHALERSRDFADTERKNTEYYVAAMRDFGTPDPFIDRFVEMQRSIGPYSASAPVQNAVQDGDTVGPFKVYHVPGHSSSDVLYVDHDEGIAFTGDHVLKGITPNPFLRRPREGEPRPKSLLEYIGSLQRTRRLDLGICYPGHGSPIHNHREIIDNLLGRVEERTQRIMGLLDNATMTPYQVCEALFPKLDPRQILMGLSVAIGHLEMLVERGLAQCAVKDGVQHFFRVPEASA